MLVATCNNATLSLAPTIFDNTDVGQLLADCGATEVVPLFWDATTVQIYQSIKTQFDVNLALSIFEFIYFVGDSQLIQQLETAAVTVDSPQLMVYLNSYQSIRLRSTILTKLRTEVVMPAYSSTVYQWAIGRVRVTACTYSHLSALCDINIEYARHIASQINFTNDAKLDEYLGSMGVIEWPQCRYEYYRFSDFDSCIVNEQCIAWSGFVDQLMRTIKTFGLPLHINESFRYFLTLLFS